MSKGVIIWGSFSFGPDACREMLRWGDLFRSTMVVFAFHYSGTQGKLQCSVRPTIVERKNGGRKRESRQAADGVLLVTEGIVSQHFHSRNGLPP